MKPFSVSARKTLPFISQGSVEAEGKIEITDAPPASVPPSLPEPFDSGELAIAQSAVEEVLRDPEIIEVPLFHNPHESRPLGPQMEEEDPIVPSRPAIIDMVAFRPVPEIQKRQTKISNKVRLALAIGGGVALGLIGTSLYHYASSNLPKQHPTTPAENEKI